MTVRAATIDDAEGIARVHVESWRAAYRGHFPDEVLDGLDVGRRTSLWRRAFELGAERSGVVVTDDGDRVTGFANYGPDRQEGSTAGEIAAIYLHPDVWGQGVGRQLMEAAVDALRGLGFVEAVLWVLDGNTRARRFYEAAGWRADGGERVDEVWGLTVAEVRYHRPL